MSKSEDKELNKLIGINEDALRFYDSALEKAESDSMRHAFRNLGDVHRRVIVHLQQHIRRQGGQPERDETLVGQANQIWGELMVSISNDVDETLVKYLEEAEDRCLHTVQDCMRNQNVSPSTKVFLQDELRALRESHDYMRDLKKSMAA